MHADGARLQRKESVAQAAPPRRREDAAAGPVQARGTVISAACFGRGVAAAYAGHAANIAARGGASLLSTIVGRRSVMHAVACRAYRSDVNRQFSRARSLRLR